MGSIIVRFIGGGMAKAQCPHVWGLGRIHIEEETVRVSRCSFQDGEIVATSVESRAFNGPGKITVRCEECGYKHTYNLHSPVLPRWVTELVIGYLDLAKERARARATHVDVYSASLGATITALTETNAEQLKRGAMSQ
jgi:hypothetical protein